ncbi:MAG: hypothetical protein AB7P67_02365 [Vicinamibacterales bacterium]
MPLTQRIRIWAVLLLALVSTAVVSSQSPQIAATGAATNIQATPQACAAERRRAEQAGIGGAELDAEAVDAETASRAKALIDIESLRRSAGTTERERALDAALICFYQARLAQLAAAARVTIVTTQPEGTVTGHIAGQLALEWAGATLVRPSAATPSLDAIAALEAGPADGSRLLLIPVPLPTAASSRQIVDALRPLKRIRMVAGPSRANATNSGVALFAPSRTPTARVTELTGQANSAASASSFSAALDRAQVTRPTDNVTATLAAVTSRLPLAPPASAARGATTPGAGNSTASTGQWPLGIAPGNLYIIEVCPPGTTGACQYQLVSGKSSQEALTVAERSRPFHFSFTPGMRFVVAKACTGPNWGAVVFHHETGNGPYAVGADCGHATPAAAMRSAGDACRRVNGGRPCGGRQWFKISVGHSGEMRSEWNNSDPTWMTAQLWAMGPPTNFTEQLLTSVEDGIAKLGRLCASRNSAAGYACFITFRKYFECGTHTPACVDPNYTARGVQP